MFLNYWIKVRIEHGGVHIIGKGNGRFNPIGQFPKRVKTKMLGFERGGQS